MASSKTSEFNPLINDLVKNATILVVIHILSKTRSGKQLFDENSVYEILYFLLGLVFYHIVLTKFVPPLTLA